MPDRSFAFAVLIALLSTMVSVGCEGLAQNEGPLGSVQVYITNEPLHDFDAVMVTIRRVELHGRNGGGESTLFVLSNEPQIFNLLELRDGIRARLAEERVPAGRYDQLRLIMGDETVATTEDGSRIRIPIAEQTGVKVTFPTFEVESESDGIELTVDIDLNESIIRGAGSETYIFRPALRADAMSVNGRAVDLVVEAVERTS